jgi:hypothetical protein
MRHMTKQWTVFSLYLLSNCIERRVKRGICKWLIIIILAPQRRLQASEAIWNRKGRIYIATWGCKIAFQTAKMTVYILTEHLKWPCVYQHQVALLYLSCSKWSFKLGIKLHTNLLLSDFSSTQFKLICRVSKVYFHQRLFWVSHTISPGNQECSIRTSAFQDVKDMLYAPHLQERTMLSES